MPIIMNHGLQFPMAALGQYQTLSITLAERLVSANSRPSDTIQTGANQCGESIGSLWKNYSITLL
jgi:hypothetical protein